MADTCVLLPQRRAIAHPHSPKKTGWLVPLWAELSQPDTPSATATIAVDAAGGDDQTITNNNNNNKW